ncbi:MAG: hypothetical protein FJ117_18540 [Deltaproteobacteria bacterium]|nr:hypothetical protein [Deltaproteobacteria bacterium]
MIIKNHGILEPFFSLCYDVCASEKSLGAEREAQETFIENNNKIILKGEKRWSLSCRKMFD